MSQPRLMAILIAVLLCGHAFAADDVQADGWTAVRRLLDAGKYGEAEAAAREHLGSLESREPPHPVAIARALDLLVEALWRGGKAKQQETLGAAERALALKEKALGSDDPELATSLQNLATVLGQRAEPERVEGLLERALAIKQKEHGPGHPELVRFLNSLGNFLAERGDFEGSSAYYLEALAIVEATSGPDDRQVAVLLNNLATNHLESGDFAKAIPLHERAVAVMRTVHAGKEHPDVAHVLNAYANTLRNLGEYERALAIHEEALAIREKTLGSQHRGVAASLNNISLVLKDQGDLAGARPVLERAIAVWEQSLGPEHPLVAQGYNNLGTLTSALGDREQARRHLETALAIREKALGPDHPLVAQTLHNLGNVDLLLGDVAAARKSLERAMAIWEATVGADSSQVAMARVGMGRLLLDAGELAPARTQLTTALSIRELQLGADHPLVAETLSLLGDLERTAGSLDSARALHERALAVRRKALGAEHPAVAASLTMLAAIDYDLGRLEEARSEAAGAAAAGRSFLRNTLGALSEREALLLIEGRPRPEVTLFSGLLARTASQRAWLEACWEWTLGQRGVVLEEMAARRRAAHLGSTPAARASWERLTAARRFLAATWVRGAEGEDTAVYREHLERATLEKEAAEIEMARVSARYREERREERVTFEDLARALPERSALVEIVRVPIRTRGSREETSHDLALILEPEGTLRFADLGPSEAIDAMVSGWREALDAAVTAQGEPEVRTLFEAGWRLRRSAWEPIAALTRGREAIFLVPDGALPEINVAALPAEDGSFLLENGPRIHLIGAGRDLARGEREGPRAAGRGVLLVGAPDFDASPVRRLAGLDTGRVETLFRGTRAACGAVTEREWPALPEAAREIALVESMLGSVESITVLNGPTASEERFKLEAPGKRLLHLATHGYFLEGRCAAAAGENPLLFSGLVLAGANAPTPGTGPGSVDDGVLTAEEVVALDLRGVDLAVLSACDTGRGQVRVGEGVLGLRRSLELAGVRSILMSVWPVPDREARRWMTSFYESLLTGAAVADAARRASLASLERLRGAGRPAHPYFWGAFVASGDWRATGEPSPAANASPSAAWR